MCDPIKPPKAKYLKRRAKRKARKAHDRHEHELALIRRLVERMSHQPALIDENGYFETP